MSRDEALFEILSRFPKCPVKTVAEFGTMQLWPLLKHGFKDCQFEPVTGEFDCVIDIDGEWPRAIMTVKKHGLIITNKELFSSILQQIGWGELNVYKRMI